MRAQAASTRAPIVRIHPSNPFCIRSRTYTHAHECMLCTYQNVGCTCYMHAYWLHEAPACCFRLKHCALQEQLGSRVALAPETGARALLSHAGLLQALLASQPSHACNHALTCACSTSHLRLVYVPHLGCAAMISIHDTW